jgi:hypothetical protein
MSSQIDGNFVSQFSSNVYFLAQQKGSRLAGAVRNEKQVGDSAFYERIGVATAVLRSGRHMDTPQIDTPSSRRRVTMSDYIYADLIDDVDKIRLLIDPQGPYSMAAMWALGRAKDDVILAAASGTAYSGVAGATSVTLPNAQKLASVASSAGDKLNIQALLRAKKKFDIAEVDPSISRYIAHSALQMESLLGTTQVTSSDYNTVKALVQGELDTFVGFKFIHTERYATVSAATSFDTTTGAVGSGSGDSNGYHKIIAWAEDGILLSTGMEVKGRIDERADKNYSVQVFAEMSLGATRMEEEKVVEIHCKNT